MKFGRNGFRRNVVHPDSDVGTLIHLETAQWDMKLNTDPKTCFEVLMEYPSQWNHLLGDAAYPAYTFFDVSNIKGTEINDSTLNNRCLRRDLF